MMRAVLALALIALASFATAAFAAQGDELWWDGFSSPDLDGYVTCAAEFDGSLVVGGKFSLVGGVEVQNIARWDGTGWHPLSGGLDGEVLDLAVYGGELVASGRFAHSGSVAVHGIARWNGSTWSPLGGGLWFASSSYSTGATALAVGSGALYATGWFDRAGTVEARGIARWDGAQWSTLGEGLRNGGGSSLLAFGDSLFVGGSFDTAGVVPASGLALWDGAAWSALGAGVSYAYGGPEVKDLIEYQGSLIVAGVIDSAGGQPASNVAAWDGQAWKSLTDSQTNGISETASALAVVGDTLLVAGYGLHAWDGTTWSLPAPYAAGWIGCLLPTSAGLVAGGNFVGYASQGGLAAVNVGIIRDGAWTDPMAWDDRRRGLGGSGRVRISALGSYQGTVVASGTFRYAGGPGGRIPLGSVARWDGATWSDLGTPPLGFTAAFLVRGDTLYAGGSFASYPFPARTPVMMYDGANWMALDTLSFAASSLAVYQGSPYAGGRRLFPTGFAGEVLCRWNGIRWESIGAFESNDGPPSVETMTVFDGRLVLGGRFSSISGVAARNFAAWDGVSWSAMDAGLELIQPRAFVECDGALYAGGIFGDTQRRAQLIRWEGSRWTLIAGSDGGIDALACANHQVFAGGVFFDHSVLSAIMTWDGQSWSPLGSGTNDVVNTMTVLDGQLYVGGQFTRAGGHSSTGIGRWDLGGDQRISAMLAATTGIPNPFRISTTIAYRLPTAGHVRVSVYDLRGRRVATLEDSQRPVGVGFATWDGRVEGGGDAPAGVYFLRLDLPGRSETRRVVRLR